VAERSADRGMWKWDRFGGARRLVGARRGRGHWGSSADTGRSGRTVPCRPEDRYTLGKVKKLQGDLWSFEARIQYGDHDVTLPLALPVKWAGDTPVISVSNVAFPGLGTYSARVVVDHGWYAGTWYGGTHGGHLFGRITHDKDKDADKPAGK